MRPELNDEFFLDVNPDGPLTTNLHGWNPPKHDPKKGGGGASIPPPTTGGPGPIISNPEASYKAALKAVMPFLSSADVKSQAALYNVPIPKNLRITGNPVDIGGGLRNQYLSADRAQAALVALTKTGQTGPGMNFLRNAIGLLKQFGSNTPNQGMSREAYTQLTTQLGALIEGAKKEAKVAPFAQLAQMFLAPSLRGGSLMEQNKNGSYGIASRKLFT